MQAGDKCCQNPEEYQESGYPGQILRNDGTKISRRDTPRPELKCKLDEESHALPPAVFTDAASLPLALSNDQLAPKYSEAIMSACEMPLSSCSSSQVSTTEDLALWQSQDHFTQNDNDLMDEEHAKIEDKCFEKGEDEIRSKSTHEKPNLAQFDIPGSLVAERCQVESTCRIVCVLDDENDLESSVPFVLKNRRRSKIGRELDCFGILWWILTVWIQCFKRMFKFDRDRTLKEGLISSDTEINSSQNFIWP